MPGKLLDYTCNIIVLSAISHHMTGILSQTLGVLTNILVNCLTPPEAEIVVMFSSKARGEKPSEKICEKNINIK